MSETEDNLKEKETRSENNENERYVENSIDQQNEIEQSAKDENIGNVTIQNSKVQEDKGKSKPEENEEENKTVEEQNNEECEQESLSETQNSFIILSECGESQDDNEDLGFTIDANPLEERKCSSYVPLFKRSRKNILEQTETSVKENDNIIIRVKNTCFNCDGDHSLRDCELPRNMKKINKARKLRMTRSDRYHVDIEQRFAHVRPGKISKTLANALGLRSNEIPTMYYKMRVLKYPPAWLEEAKIAHSGITLFGSKGYTVLGSDDDEGELDESKLKYDLSKIISFPGFNIHPGEGYFDDFKYQGVPPFSTKDNKQYFIRSFHQSAAKQGYKRRKLNIDVEQNYEVDLKEEIQVADMEVDDDEMGRSNQNLQLLLNQPPPPIENPPTPPLPPDDSSDKIFKDEKCVDPIINDELNKSTKDGYQELSLTDLEVKQAELLKLLNTNNENTKSPNELIENESEKNVNQILDDTVKTHLTPESCQSSQNNSVTDIKVKEIKIGLLKSSTVGTPILKFTPYDKLPSEDQFKEGVSDVINFENLPDSTGKYDQMKKILYKVRKRIVEINETDF